MSTISELNKVLNKDEKIIWQGGPKFLPFVFGQSILLSIIGIVFVGFALVFMSVFSSFFSAFSDPRYFDSTIKIVDLKHAIFMFPPFWIGIFILFGPYVYNLFSFKRTYYAITDKRVIIQEGVIGRDFKTVDFDKITNIQVVVGIVDKIFGNKTGSILISTPDSVSYNHGSAIPNPYKISNITSPYEVYKLFTKTEFDIKTDIEYPNKLRPSENPGYKTNYKP